MDGLTKTYIRWLGYAFCLVLSILHPESIIFNYFLHLSKTEIILFIFGFFFIFFKEKQQINIKETFLYRYQAWRYTISVYIAVLFTSLFLIDLQVYSSLIMTLFVVPFIPEFLMGEYSEYKRAKSKK